MRKTRALILRWLLLPVFVAAAVLSVELICNMRTLSLPQEQKGVIAIDLTAAMTGEETEEAAEEEGEDWSDEEWAEDEWSEEEEEEELTFDDDDATIHSGSADGAVVLDGPGMTLALPYEGYIDTLTLEGSAASTVVYRLQWTGPDGETHTAQSWFAEFLNEDSINLHAQVADLVLTHVQGGELAIEGAAADNTFVWNFQRMLLVGLLTAALYLLAAFRSWYADRMPMAFLTVALAAGIWLCVAVPVNVGISFDDQIHTANVFNLAGKTDGRVPGGLEPLTEMQWLGNDAGHVLGGLDRVQPDTRKDQLALRQKQLEADAAPAELTDSRAWEFSDTGYVTQVPGIWLGKLLGFGLRGQLMLARLGNLLAFVLLTFAALCVLQRFRFTLAAVALAPATLFIASTVSYDPLGTGLLFLGAALAVDAIMDPRTRLSWLRGVGILFCITLGSLTKTVYIPMILLVLLLPRSKFADTRSRLIFQGIAAALFLAVLLTRVVPTSGNLAALEDSRADNVDSAGQIAFLLAHPFTYLSYFFAELFNGFRLYFLDGWRVSLAYAGDLGGFVAILSLLLVLFTAFTDHDDRLARSTLCWYQRLGIFAVAALVVGLVFTVMYIAFVPVGMKSFLGMQPRYLLPVLPLCFFLLSPDGIRNRMNRVGWTLVFSVINLGILGWTCWTLILSPWLL